MLNNEPGKVPREDAVLPAAKAMAAKAHRELTAQQRQEPMPTEPQRRGGLRISPSTFNQRFMGDWLPIRRTPPSMWDT